MASVTQPVLARLLRLAFPALRVLDTGVLRGGLWPLWPEAILALPGHVDLQAPEWTLLAALGLQPTDPALAAGAPEAWGGSGPRLVVTETSPRTWLMAGALVLTHAPVPPTEARILLLLGSGDAVEQHHLLLSEAAMSDALAALSAAAQAMVAPGWSYGMQIVSSRFATLTLVAPQRFFEPLSLAASTLPQQIESPGRRRVLLGPLPPWPMHVQVEGKGMTALYLDGAPHENGAVFTPRRGEPVVLGLAGPDVVMQKVEIGLA